MAPAVMRLSLYPVDHRVPCGAFSRLEPCAVKVACTVLRGRGDGNVTPLPDGYTTPSRTFVTPRLVGMQRLLPRFGRRVSGTFQAYLRATPMAYIFCR